MLLITFCLQAQGLKIETGVYKGSSQGQEIMLKLNEDKTFEMTFFYGNYTIENDSIYFKSDAYDASKFELKPIADAVYSSSIKLRFGNGMDGYDASSILIGTQKNQNTQISYQRLSEFMDAEAYGATPKQLVIDVPRCQFLYLVSLNYDQDTSIAKYEIGEDVNMLAVEYNPYSIRDVKLIGYIDEDSQKLSITDAKKAVFFTIEKDNGWPKNDNTLNALSVTEEKDWAKNNGFELENETVYSYTDYTYDFKHVVDHSYEAALKTVQNSLSKFLVVAFDQQNTKKQEDFHKFITSSEEVISSYMYDIYNKEYDRFNFYLATDKDKKLLDKNSLTSSKEILVYNSAGDLLYHTSGTLNDNSELFAPYSNLISNLEKANVAIAIDNGMANKKASLTDLTAAYKLALSIERSYNDTLETVEESTEYAETIVEETLDAYDPYGTKLKDNQNLYALKSTQQMVEAQWSTIVDAYIKNDVYNDDFVHIVKKELADDGFNLRMFNETNDGLTDLDFKLLDYVYKHLDEIATHEAQSSLSEVNDHYNIDQSMTYILEQMVFNYTNTSSESISDPQMLKKTLEYYKNYLDSSNTDFTAFYNYLNALETVESDGLKKHYLDTYNNLYLSMVKNDRSLIENLDASYSVKYREQTWTEFKSMFAGLANTTSWYVVENDKENTYVSQAINWSETATSLDKTNHYYMDTLAQLYYKNGQKEKGISTEQNAINLTEDAEAKSDYELVLEKMKNGTY